MSEIWKPVVGYESRYDVSNLGRVRTAFESPHPNARPFAGRLRKLYKSTLGYIRVSLNRDGVKSHFSVHILVLQAFRGRRPAGHVSRHLDGSRNNSELSNLEWSTQSRNLADRIKHGTHNKGSRHPNSKLTESDAVKIRLEAAHGKANTQIAREFGVTPANIGYVVNRKSWTHI